MRELDALTYVEITIKNTRRAVKRTNYLRNGGSKVEPSN
jgi:hypothetical protein